MALEISQGIQRGAVRAVIYGVEGIGKTSLAAKLPGSLILDVEDGSRQIDCRRVRIKNATHAKEVMREIIAKPSIAQTVVIDTADWLEQTLIDDLLTRYNVNSIEKVDGGWGKGYTMAREAFNGFLGLCDQLIEKGVHVVFLAHSTVKRVSPPDQTDGYDRYELKLSRQSSPLLKEWAELLLFAHFEIQIVEGTDKKLKAQGGDQRVIETVFSAAWDAKNRFGLPSRIPMEVSEIEHLFTGVPSAPTEPKKTTPPPVPAPQKDEPEKPMATAGQLEFIRNAAKEPTLKALIDTALEFEAAKSIDDLVEESALRLIADIKQASPSKQESSTPPPVEEKKTSKLPIPASVVTKLEAEEKAVNAFLTSNNWIAAGQTWRDTKPADVETLITKVDKIIRAAKAAGAK